MYEVILEVLTILEISWEEKAMSVPPSTFLSYSEAIFCYIPPKRITSSRVVTQKNPQKIVSQCDIRNRNDLAIISE